MVARRCVGSSSQVGGRLRGILSGNFMTSSVGKSRNLSLPARDNDDRPCVIQHVGDEGFGQRGIEKKHGTAGLKDAEMRGHDLPIVLRHGHGNDLIGSREIARKGRRDVFRPCVELSEGNGLSGVRNLQGREMRKLLSGAAEYLCEPADSLLMRHVQELPVIKDVGQAVLGGIRLSARRLVRHPKIPPPGRKRQQTESGQSDYKN